MKKVNYDELENIIKEYAVKNDISEPLVVFLGKYQEGACLKTIKEIWGDSNFHKIGSVYDNPRADIPYCLYDGYYGKAENNLLLHCFEVAKKIQRPIFCFISSDYEEVVPKEVYNQSLLPIDEQL